VIRFMCAMHAIVSSDAARKRMSEVLAIVAMELLLLYIADAALEFFGNSRFLPLSVTDRGIIFGGGTLALFIVSNVFIFTTRKISRLAPTLLIAGGTIIGTTVIASAAIPDVKTPESVITIAILGYMIAIFGVFWIFRRKSEFS
jgi:hypothetical protein